MAQEVAVKVLRPGIAEAFARDLDLFLWLAGWIERLYAAVAAAQAGRDRADT